MVMDVFPIEKQSLELTLVFDNIHDMVATMKYAKRMDNKGSIMGGYHGKCNVKFCENTLALMSEDLVATYR
jgi:hypothetical protein|tara:strand:+ start:2852 stop:3064 length:213 start_codon:yes stop_codon:yes gene_type:complete